MKLQRQSIRLLLLVLILLVAPTIKGQDVIVADGESIGMTPLQFVQTYLVGTGVTVTNALFNGSNEPLNSIDRLPLKSRNQIGSFENSGGAQSQLGLAGGVLLSSGYVRGVLKDSLTSGDMWGSYPGESDPDLVILAGVSLVHDKSILEFDFVPVTDVVSFRYVFGSVEFDQFCGSYNDAFGLLLSGPAIAGGLGFSNDAVNIALLPNSTNYVNINNICAADEGNQGNGIYSWRNLKYDYYSYYRFTYVFTASYPVQCNQTYHMKFVIGDAGDGTWDTGVFLEQNSFSSNSLTSTTSFSNPLTSQILVEGCNNVSLSYSLQHTQATDLIIDLAIQPSGSANQADILPNPFPVHDTIHAGQLQSSLITIIPVADGIPESTENIVITGSTMSCGLATSITSEFTIHDYSPLAIGLNNVTICNGMSDTLTPTITGGQQILPDSVFNYLWSTGATTSSIIVTPPPGHHEYSVTVTDACNQTAFKQISLDVGTSPGAAGNISGIDSICTPQSGLIYSIPTIPGVDRYFWTVPPGAVITSGNVTNSITVNYNETTTSGTISVFGHSDVCGDGEPAILNLVINPSVPAAGAITGVPSHLCQGPTVYTCTILPLSYVTSYEWSLPPGVELLSGSNTNQITCRFGPTAISGNISVRGYNNECGFGAASFQPVIVDPLPGPAGTIGSSFGNFICKPQSGNLFEVSPIAQATNYSWVYTGVSGTAINNGTQLMVDFSDLSTSGNLSVSGQNSCGFGPASPIFPITVNPKPNVEFLTCQDIKTTKNGKPILLRGGRPNGPGGAYRGTGVREISPDIFIFDPADNNVTGGGSAGMGYTITYRYTNMFNCSDEKPMNITVYGSNANTPCPGTVKDVRDNKIYPIFSVGAGVNFRCWTSINLNYGNFIDQTVIPSDNCLPEKLCRSNQSGQCTSYGGYYHWDEIMQYQQGTYYQDLCMPGWHVSTVDDWQILIGQYLGNGQAGNFLKDTTASNNFDGLLNGVEYLNNTWSHLSAADQGTMYWTSQSNSPNSATARGLTKNSSGVSVYESSRANAFSVRCVRN